MPSPIPPAVERSIVPSATPRTATSTASATCSPTGRSTSGSTGLTPPGTSVSSRAATTQPAARTAVSRAVPTATTTVRASSRRVRRGTAVNDDIAMPVTCSPAPTRTPRTTSTSWPKPNPVSAAPTAKSARGAESVIAAPSQPRASTSAA